MKIAICLSGQPRSIEFAAASILDHFKDGRDGHTYDFFCHVWDFNTWKLQDISWTEPESVDHSWLEIQLQKFNPKSFIIGSAGDADKSHPGRFIPYHSLLYSTMMSNYLKRKYEFENKFKYDCVFKVRYDSVFVPGYYPDLPRTMPERTLYFPHLGRMDLEYRRFNSSDCLYYGDNWGMDIASDLFRHFEIISNFKEDDCEKLGPGTTMTRYLQSMHFHLIKATDLPEIIYRKESLGLNPLDSVEFGSIQSMHRSFYIGKKF